MLFAVAWIPVGQAQSAPDSHSAQGDTFTNPLLPSGADPWITEWEGTYYYTNTTGRNITLWATKDPTDLAHASSRVVWTPTASVPGNDVWAPEIHRFRGKWYVYFAADMGSNDSHRLYVLENAAADPLTGTWEWKGQIKDSTDKWAIDGSAFELQGQLYLIWSGWRGDGNGEQDIFLAHMSNPWTIDSERTLISSPKYSWEQVGDLLGDPKLPHVNVNEGPEFLQHGDDVFVVYSAAGCWTDYYALGLLRAKSTDDLLKASSWKKYDHFFFRKDDAAKVYGTGHNSFFKSPDGKQDWLLYHANDAPGLGCGAKRSPRAQPFSWNADGTPDFGTPVPVGKAIPKPSR